MTAETHLADGKVAALTAQKAWGQGAAGIIEPRIGQSIFDPSTGEAGSAPKASVRENGVYRESHKIGVYQQVWQQSARSWVGTSGWGRANRVPLSRMSIKYPHG